MNDDNFNGFKKLYVRQNELQKEFSGKVVKDILLTYEAYDTSHNKFFITFTDNTFICIGSEEGEKDGIDFISLESDSIPSNAYILENAHCYSYIDHSTGEVELYPFAQGLVDMGLYTLTPDFAKKVKEQRAKEEEDREYQQYLRLKKKFEK